MKIWYQSLSREGAWEGYAKFLRAFVDRIKDPETEIEVHGTTKIGGTAEHFRYLEYLSTGEVMENLNEAIRRKFDAFLIGNIYEPGLRECREIAEIPVLGLGETAYHVASMMGANFALITVNEKAETRLLENVARSGLRERLAGIGRMSVDRILDLDATFEDAEARKAVISGFLDIADRQADAGAEVIIPACGVPTALLAHDQVFSTSKGVPILNGIVSLVKMGEMTVRLRRLMGGTFTSKRLLYAPPTADQIDELRHYYGAGIYPTVKPD